MAEVTVTPVTSAPSPLTRWERLPMAGANALPFCSRAALSEVGVLALKNFSQFAVICATAAELPEAEAGDDAGAEEAGADVAGADVAGADVVAGADTD